MKIKQATLTDVALRATQSSSRALSLLAGEEVTVKTTQAAYLSLDRLIGLIHSKDGSRVIAFSQLISGVKGAALLVMGHTDALHLVDSLLKQPIGTTKAMGDIEKSAIKETLNILSNSQLTMLSRDLGVTVNVMPPNLIAQESVARVLDYLASQRGDDTEIIVFETSLMATGRASQVTMLIVFDSELASLIENKEQS